MRTRVPSGTGCPFPSRTVVVRTISVAPWVSGTAASQPTSSSPGIWLGFGATTRARS